MTKPNAALKEFHQAHCSDLAINSTEVFYKLLSEIEKLRKEKSVA